MKAHFNLLLEQQKLKVQSFESQVSNSKLTYAEALRNLEQISDEIHQTRSKASSIYNAISARKQDSVDSNESYAEDVQEFSGDYKSLPDNLDPSLSPVYSKLEEVEGYRNIVLPRSVSPSEYSERAENPSVAPSRSSEWTEINLDVSSPEEDSGRQQSHVKEKDSKPKLLKQKTLPNPSIENEFSAIKSRIKLDTNISNWISRSSAKTEAQCLSNSKK